MELTGDVFSLHRGLMGKNGLSQQFERAAKTEVNVNIFVVDLKTRYHWLCDRRNIFLNIYLDYYARSIKKTH
jgi:hypothetical protein